MHARAATPTTSAAAHSLRERAYEFLPRERARYNEREKGSCEMSLGAFGREEREQDREKRVFLFFLHPRWGFFLLECYAPGALIRIDSGGARLIYRNEKTKQKTPEMGA
jgi:hypothetical protein